LNWRNISIRTYSSILWGWLGWSRVDATFTRCGMGYFSYSHCT